MKIKYSYKIIPHTDAVVELYKDSGLPRPIHDKKRIQQMYENSDLIITAWDNELLVGVARSLTDFCWCCYLADLSVKHSYKNKGIGKKLIELTKERIGSQSMLLLLSVSEAMTYYPKVGFNKVENGFIINRIR